EQQRDSNQPSLHHAATVRYARRRTQVSPTLGAYCVASRADHSVPAGRSSHLRHICGQVGCYIEHVSAMRRTLLIAILTACSKSSGDAPAPAPLEKPTAAPAPVEKPATPPAPTAAPAAKLADMAAGQAAYDAKQYATCAETFAAIAERDS